MKLCKSVLGVQFFLRHSVHSSDELAELLQCFSRDDSINIVLHISIIISSEPELEFWERNLNISKSKSNLVICIAPYYGKHHC